MLGKGSSLALPCRRPSGRGFWILATVRAPGRLGRDAQLWVGLADADQGPPQLLAAVAVLPGNAPDAQGALELVAQSEQHTRCRHGFYATATGARAPRPSFHFDPALCTACPLRPRCVATGAKSVCTRRKPCCRRPHAPAQCGFRTLTPSSPSRGASPGPAGATGAATDPVPRASQDRLPALSQRHRRRPDLHPGRQLTPHRGIPRGLDFFGDLTPAAKSPNNWEHAWSACVPRSGPT